MKKDKNSHSSKYNANLKGIKLEGDTLLYLQKFWHANDNTITFTLNENKYLGGYEYLTQHYLEEDTLGPPLGHS